MYRVCVGYVSRMCRESVERYRERKGFQGHGKRGKYLPRIARRDAETRNNYLLRAEREKSKLSKLQTDYYLQQPKQHKPTTHCARNNTASAQGYGQTTELHGTARKPVRNSKFGICVISTDTILTDSICVIFGDTICWELANIFLGNLSIYETNCWLDCAKRKNIFTSCSRGSRNLNYLN